MAKFYALYNRPAPRDAAYARDIIALMKRHTPSVTARKSLAQNAASRHGNYTDEAKEVFAAYLADGCPA